MFDLNLKSKTASFASGTGIGNQIIKILIGDKKCFHSRYLLHRIEYTKSKQPEDIVGEARKIKA